ncbi:hypothetical protein A3G67_03050 [Candidatus Roizmanbacteria bacterium RIFCSPLOWO2_12_FULL_40_12]|uniref:IPT/TIG domain-containing protein n=1 Tax=Candidatus Roizmanbacteria bacterium RIFCSPLOWO2_01_FULL_40_42 TaxID=1802066 RepID=A0A1F7J5D6_9BACT|nr:MAG: hypothetical protein A2779_02685 [Candidatus Roizmanbacteria bacterium RIFCSPHIGHO2_01_FULL_40_98]OGK28251.1 MAG: hypothetical protein A3C31_00050 [Candidatus Roizmanbacteria bacterium RIFCSPHIGHO2_02_FULL_40_53]OGK30487.1 MAG: hypothetical protein A2W49_02735 [Candidatus Roizmanbacteria bacterium RIFCSPHIGHO2_12_41_18]OGK36901.1 MAG: hypothetical protein A3E69_00310 [Candidatus Roizmanbacteria bacterium RIFCSPHIGHO2_12_FULL_40_130]OGK50807.1 MAG: hypothetical protein A3B50_00820 [Candi
MTRKIDGLVIFIWVYLVIVLPSLFILYFIKISSPELNAFSNLLKTTPDFPAILISTIALSTIGVCLSLFRRKMSLIDILELLKQEKVYFVALSLFISIILWRFFSVFDTLDYFGLIIIFVFFFFFLPILNGYLNSVDFNKVKLFITPSVKKPALSLIENLLFGLALLLLLHTSVFALDAQIRAYNHRKIILSRYPTITNHEPKIVYYGTKVILTGRRFGWKGNIDANLRHSAGKINIDLWTDTEIIFTIPLHWKEGKIEIWIEKSVEAENSKIKKVKSNKVSLQLISRDNGWDEGDEAYFKQLKKLDKKTLRINGYAPE